MDYTTAGDLLKCKLLPRYKRERKYNENHGLSQSNEVYHRPNDAILY